MRNEIVEAIMRSLQLRRGCMKAIDEVNQNIKHIIRGINKQIARQPKPSPGNTVPSPKLREKEPPALLESRTEKIREMRDIDIAKVQTMLDLIGKGYKVYQNVNTPEYDLIAMKDNRFFRVGITEASYELNGNVIYDFMSNLDYDIIAAVTFDKVFYRDADGFEIKDLTPSGRHGMKLKR